ncbi:hypothetical protein COOONC_01672 [Cooperia oncophora]
MVFGSFLSLTSALSLCLNGTDCNNGSVVAQPPPVIEYGHQNQTLMVGSSATLPCQASGRTPPRISWLLDGNPVDTTKDNRYSQHSSGSLHIADLK